MSKRDVSQTLQGARGKAARTQWLLAVAALVIAALLPLALKNFVLFQLTLAMSYAIAILGLALLTGFNGQFSLGHSAFFAVGAYTAAIMMDHWGISYIWTLPVAGVASLVFGFLFGLPALRLQGIYLALATFSLAVAAPQLLKSKPLEPWTGGVQGIVIVKPDAPFGLPLSSDQWLYYLTLAVVVVAFVCAANLINSRTGRALIAIRDNPIAARAMGIDISLYKALTFGVSAFYTGVAGALGRDRHPVRRARQLHLLLRHRAVRWTRGGRRRFHLRRPVRRPVRAVRAEHCRRCFQGPRGRRLWRDPDTRHLR